MLDESTTAKGEFDLILARLRSELTRGGASAAGEEAGEFDGFALRRDEAERLWAVSAERRFLFRPGVWGRSRGLVLVPLKSVLRKLMRWYVEPLAADQRRFNAAALRLVDALSERADAGRAELQRSLWELERNLGELGETLRTDTAETARQSVELAERLTRLERRERAAVPAGPATGRPTPVSAGQAVFPDYFAYESRMRGSTDLV